MYSAVSKNYEMSFNIITHIFAVDFDCYTVGSVIYSSCAGEHMPGRLNQLLN